TSFLGGTPPTQAPVSAATMKAIVSSRNNNDQNELGAFLRARRSELGPSDVDLHEGGTQRRVAGLRREEVATLAAISTDYYTRLEQGRIQASCSVLNSLCQVLHLTQDQRAYLLELASRHRPRPEHRPGHYEADGQMQRMLDDMTHTPA